MKRSAYKQLTDWKSNSKRKPLVLQGARQVGKTYLVNEFGKREYSNYFYFNFEQDESLKTLFENNLSPDKIIDNIGLYIGEKIVAEDTLLFFDEIQVAPKVLKSLKYFYEQAPGFHIIAAGSLLGVSFGPSISLPVGKVNFLTMYPMSFSEFLIASGEKLLAGKLDRIAQPEALPDILHTKLLANYSKFKVYLHDVGLLAALLNISSELIVSPTRIFAEFNGTFIENFVAQELLYYGHKKLFYWTSRSDAKVDFIIESSQNIFPVEVKSGTGRNLKSLRSYSDKYNPKQVFRLSPGNFVQAGDFTNIPLYAINTLVNLAQ